MEIHTIITYGLGIIGAAVFLFVIYKMFRDG